MGSHPDRPVVNERYCKLKRHLKPHCGVGVVHPHGHTPEWAHCCCPTSWERTVTRFTRLGKVKIQNSKYGFYWTHTAFEYHKIKTLKSTIISQGPPAVEAGSSTHRKPRNLNTSRTPPPPSPERRRNTYLPFLRYNRKASCFLYLVLLKSCFASSTFASSLAILFYHLNSLPPPSPG